MIKNIRKIRVLIAEANRLDQLGLFKQADILDQRIFKLAEAAPTFSQMIDMANRGAATAQNIQLPSVPEDFSRPPIPNQPPTARPTSRPGDEPPMALSNRGTLYQNTATRDRSARSGVPTAPAPAPAAAPTHTVAKGESLASIAKNKLGDYRKWQQIYDLNKDQIGADPNRINPGTVLKLPA